MKIKSAHSEKEIAQEAALMIRPHGVTLETLMRLDAVKSRLLLGGRYDMEEAKRTRGIIGGYEKWKTAVEEIAAAFRALEIIVPSEAGVSKSKIPAFSPEWLADVLETAARAANDTALNVLFHYPLTLTFHLIAAEHRRNGGITRRPLDRESVVNALKEAGNG